MKKHIFISGRVQGVGFRHFTKANASKLGVKGWVRNLDDGRVEAVLEGSEEQVQELIKRCKEGPTSAYVDEIKAKNENGGFAYSDFEVRF